MGARKKIGGPFFGQVFYLTLLLLLIEIVGVGKTALFAQDFSYTGSMQWSTGSYFFGEQTQSWYFVNGLGWANDSWDISVSIPLVIQNSPWISYTTSGQLPTGGPQHGALHNQSESEATLLGSQHPILLKDGSGQGRGGRKTISLPDTSSYTQIGFSDPSLSTGYEIWSSSSYRTVITINGSIKFPLADPTSGFGTGAWDGGAGVAVMHRIRTWFLVTDVMYWWLGDFEDLTMQNPLTYSIGLGKSIAGGDWMMNVMYSGYTEVINGYDPPQSLSWGMGYTFSPSFSLNSTVSIGLSESSSDFSAGIGWSWNW
jgi:hypothetical protein